MSSKFLYNTFEFRIRYQLTPLVFEMKIVNDITDNWAQFSISFIFSFWQLDKLYTNMKLFTKKLIIKLLYLFINILHFTLLYYNQS